MNLNTKRELFKRIVQLYIENRHSIYCYHGYSNQALQINADLATNKRKGKTGIKQILNVLEPYSFIKANSLNEFNNYKFMYILPDKGDKELFDKILKDKNIRFQFRKERENKNPDLLIKIGDEIFIVEHKLTNGSGGTQNAGINEIIRFISHSEINPKVHYVSCLQGNVFRKLNQQNEKSKIQHTSLIDSLKMNPQNFFLNNNGFSQLILDYIRNR
ncbi:hypothetical protein [Mycoplasmopsis adleri]|uniref:hypothetical protein n=1 Tax=Mycoplasmopsis adleri TaxID=51362 RepID=UPI0038735B17